MDKKPLLIGGAVIVVFLVLPIVMQAVQMAGPPPAVAAPTTLEPPLLNAQNLVGSMWEVEPRKGVKVSVTLNSGGTATAFTANPLVKQLAGTDTLSGTWSVDGAALNVSTHFQGKDLSTKLTISGDKVYADGGIPVVRLR